jgi:uncharacterized protein YkwD
MPNRRAPRHQLERHGHASLTGQARHSGAGARRRSRYAWALLTLPLVLVALVASAAPPAAQAAAHVGTPADQVLGLINRARAQAGLPALVLSAALGRSASAHNLAMARGCGLAHQCAGEPALGARETAAGARWTSAGENIGAAGPEPGTAAAIAQAEVALTKDMLNEQPPADGHRRNMLSSAFGQIGIAVYEDRAGTVWMTQDFSG